MIINGFNVNFSIIKNEVWITFDCYSGTLTEIIRFRKSFDYECYPFGDGRFYYAKWKNMIADDHNHQVYPQEIGLIHANKTIIISWDNFETLLIKAKNFARENKICVENDFSNKN